MDSDPARESVGNARKRLERTIEAGARSISSHSGGELVVDCILADLNLLPLDERGGYRKRLITAGYKLNGEEKS
jgi:hypothetical protein